MKIKLLQSVVFIFLLAGVSYSQIQYASFGGSIGIGEIQGNSSPVPSLGANVFVDMIPWFSDGMFSIRAGFLYAQKVEHFLPENRTGRYYPFIKSFWMKGVLRQLMSENIFLEEGAGLILLNDRTFGDVNSWEAGASFNAMGGIDFRELNSGGITVGLGLDYGITFTGTTASYYLLYAQIQYYP